MCEIPFIIFIFIYCSACVIQVITFLLWYSIICYFSMYLDSFFLLLTHLSHVISKNIWLIYSYIIKEFPCFFAHPFHLTNISNTLFNFLSFISFSILYILALFSLSFLPVLLNFLFCNSLSLGIQFFSLSLFFYDYFVFLLWLTIGLSSFCFPFLPFFIIYFLFY